MVARTFVLGAAMAAVAQAAAMYGNGTVTTTTEVVDTITTYCPGPTTLTYGDKTYTVTEATTLTITDCSCTLTHPIVKPTTTKPAEIVYTTEVVTAITTYCPEATTLTHGNMTYTVTEPTTLTITNCPCTLTKPVPQPQPTGMPPAPQPQPPAPENSAPPAGGNTVPVVPPPASETPTQVPTAGAGRVVPGALVALGAIALL